MRNIKTIELSEGRVAEVKELRVKDARRLIGGMAGVGMADLLGDKFADAIGLLGDCLTLPADEAFDDLSLADALAIVQAFEAVNQVFFRQIGLDRLMAATLPSASTAPAADSSSAAT